MIDQECQHAYGNAENGHAGKGFLLADEKHEVRDVKESIMKQEKPSRLPLCFPRWLNGLVIDAETFRGELLQIEYPAPIEAPNDDALSPVDPHNISHVPFLHGSKDDCHKIGKDKECRGLVGTEVSGKIHLSILGANVIMRSFEMAQSEAARYVQVSSSNLCAPSMGAL